MAPRQRIVQFGAPTAQPDSLLYTLPPELRLMTFELVVPCPKIEPSTAERTTFVKKNGSCTRLWRRRLAFLSTCRAVYYEACGIFYTHREIGLDNDQRNSNEVRQFIRAHSAQKLAAIREISIIISDAKDATTITKLLVRCSGLKHLKFVIAGEGYRLRTRSLRGERERSAVLWNRGLQEEQKALERAMSKLKSLTRLELVVE